MDGGVKVARDDGEPLYRQIVRALRDEIEARLRPGEAIATEAELERRFGVSRITVRRAVDDLVQEGLLIRRQGSGTFVSQPKVSEQLGVLLSWTEGMRALGLEPRTVDCEIQRVVPPPWVARALRLAEHPAGAAPTVFQMRRLRYADDEPLCLMVDYLRPEMAPDLDVRGLDGESLYETLERRYGIHLDRAEDTVTARAASVLEARLLGLDPGAPVLFVTRITYLPDDEPLAAATVVSRADRYEYRVAGRPRRLSMRERVQAG